VSKSQADIRYRVPRVICLRLQPTALLSVALSLYRKGAGTRSVGIARTWVPHRQLRWMALFCAGSAPGCRISARLQEVHQHAHVCAHQHARVWLCPGVGWILSWQP
jgi:hypothetical protein